MEMETEFNLEKKGIILWRQKDLNRKHEGEKKRFCVPKEAELYRQVDIENLADEVIIK